MKSEKKHRHLANTAAEVGTRNVLELGAGGEDTCLLCLNRKISFSRHQRGRHHLHQVTRQCRHKRHNTMTLCAPGYDAYIILVGFFFCQKYIN